MMRIAGIIGATLYVFFLLFIGYGFYHDWKHPVIKAEKRVCREVSGRSNGDIPGYLQCKSNEEYNRYQCCEDPK